MPVTTTRWPTWLGSCALFEASTTSMDAGFFFRNPDFQLRAFGAWSPVVFFRRNVSSSCSRHPVMVTGACCPAACRADDLAVDVDGAIGSRVASVVANLTAAGAGRVDRPSATLFVDTS